MDGAGAGRPETGERLVSLIAGMAIPYGGDKVARVSPELAARFAPGDRLIVLQDSGALLHVPAAEQAIAEAAIGRASAAFARMGEVGDDQITAFFDAFAAALDDDAIWGRIAEANARDVADAERRGRSTTRLKVSDRMRGDMVAGLRAWRDSAPARGAVVEAVTHEGW
ncbi:MAG: glutamate-5-semialdehyde dehydrogenase, partial [Caulobacteraceae bacterium]|nr:glutamate-5-semialdehyde dehydrogenase [Caulobacteraceae bacterium]